ncbi:hypothetical protein [Amycolatopsis sp. cmx-8-4]|uniref:hypothetical protein n=1 Tax=Amycolatopsis sp. cmx-8-4 TaxID=2790947 RepID=UPI00397A7758
MPQSADRIVAALALPERKRNLDAVVPLPVADLGPLVDGGSVIFSLVRVAENGVVAARMAMEALGWATGLTIRLSVSSRLLVVAPCDSRGQASVPPKMSLTMPARLRAQCRIRPGDQVLLAALVEHDLLVVYPQHVLHEMVTAYHTDLASTPHRTAAK